MLIEITDGIARAEIATLGAELQSFRVWGREQIWQGDPAIWDGRAMVLFPFIGRCCNDSYLYNGRRYTMGLHGFAWKREFRVVERSKSCCVLELTDSPQTRENYPFAFALRVRFALRDGTLRVLFEVHNHSREPMPFALGWHPGFALDGPPEGYQVRFGAPALEEIRVVPKCMVTGERERLPLTDGALELNRELFLSSARVFRAPGSSVRLANRWGQILAELDFPGFQNLTLWQTLGSGAKFICMEPWLGRPGRYDHVEILGRDGKICLPPREVLCREIVLRSGISSSDM